MPVAYGYCRVSDESQVQTGLSLDAQKQACQEHYERLKIEQPGLKWGGCFVDPAVSGTMDFLNRPAGRALQDRINDGDFLIAAKVDRVFRTMENCIVTINMWRRTGITICFLDCPGNQDDPAWILMVTVKGGLAQFEVDTTKQRMMAVIDQKRKRGEAISRRPPIGYRFYMGHNAKGHFKKMIQPDPEAERYSGYIIAMRSGGWSWNRIAYMLNESGHKTPIGGRWQQDIVSRYHKWGIKKGLKGNPEWRNQISSSLLSCRAWKRPRQRPTQADQSTSSISEKTPGVPRQETSSPAQSSLPGDTRTKSFPG